MDHPISLAFDWPIWISCEDYAGKLTPFANVKLGKINKLESFVYILKHVVKSPTDFGAGGSEPRCEHNCFTKFEAIVAAFMTVVAPSFGVEIPR